ncbi:MAG: AAA family ATPase [Pseudonocardia sp.]|nr:AAA family ATPase [Pseudonocardia sp.]
MTDHTCSGDVTVGRERELAVLHTVFDAVSAGRPTIVLLTGEAGIGKTRLADEAALMARTRRMRVLRGEADTSTRQPMELWRGVYRSLHLVPPSDPTLPAAERRWEHLETLVEALISAAPAVVVLEDLQWADAMAVWVLEHLPRALDDARVAFVATSRTPERDMPRLDPLRRVSRAMPLTGLGVDAVRRLAAAEAQGSVDAAGLHARTGGNPLFVKELVRSPDGSGVIGEVLQASLDRFDAESAAVLATVAVAGAGVPLSVLALACTCTTDAVVRRLAPAVREGVLDDVSPSGVRFHHALLAEAAQRLGDPRKLHARLAAAWTAVDGVDGRSAAAGHRMRAAVSTSAVTGSVDKARTVAAELIDLGQQARAAALLWDAHESAVGCVEPGELRANVALDLADVLSWLGDLDPALSLYQEAALLARDCADPVTRARAEIGATLWATAFVPDLARMHRLEEALDGLPPEELRLRARLRGRLTIGGGADVDAAERVRAWADEAVAVARATGDPALIAQSLLDRMVSPTSRSAPGAGIVAADEVVRRAGHAGRTDLAVHGHQRRAGYHLDHGDIGAAVQALGRAEVLAALLPSPEWRHSTLLQRTTLLALSGSRSAATAAMYEAVRVGTGHIEAVVVLGCEALHQLMLFDLYGHPDPRAHEIHRITMEMLDAVPSPVFQVQKGYGAQLFGDEPGVQEVLVRFGPAPDRLLRSMTGDHLLRTFGDTVARAGAATYAGPVYRALLPYAGLLNVGGGHSAGLPVDDVLGRLAALDGDVVSAVRHARDAVTLARSMPSPPLLVHCLDHLADAVERTGDGTENSPGELDVDVLRAEADTLAAAIDIRRPGRAVPAGAGDTGDTPASAGIRRDGPMWVLASPLGTARLPHSIGLRQLARLLRTPRQEVSAVELGGRTHTPVAADLGPALDADAKRAYRRRLRVLQAEVDDAEAAGDPVRAEHAHAEMEALLRELKRAVGLAGRDRPSGSDAERARVNVVRSLRRSIAAIAAQAPLLGAHLEATVRTGGHCIYLPEPGTALSWTVPADTNQVAASTGP